jgi:cytochrome c553
MRIRSAHTHFGFLGAIGVAALVAPACSSNADPVGTTATSAFSNDPTDPCVTPAGCISSDKIQVLTARMGYGQTSAPVAYTGTPKYDALRFSAITGDQVDIVVSAPDGEAEAWLTNSEFGILAFVDNPPGSTANHIKATILSDGSMKHYIVFREKSMNPATFTVTLNGPPPLTIQSTRIAQTDIDKGVYNADQLFGLSHTMFGHTFTLADGLGNALLPPLAGPNPAPNSRAIHNGKFGGPDATKCTQCHGVGGGDGAGTLAQNLLQDGDGVNMSSVLLRNPPAIIGDGAIQQLGVEMTADLHAQLAAAKAAVAAGGTDAGSAEGGAVGGPAPAAQTFPLSSKGVSFGSIAVHADGSVDFSQLDGVDSDLIVKPLGWKGRTAAIRRFVEGGFQVHLGMASQFLISENCGKNPIPNTVGNGPDCTDPDNDGVRDEILESQLTEMALYPALLQIPIRMPVADPTAAQRAENGEQLFNSVGCASCHVTALTLQSPIHEEFPDLSGGPAFTVDLTVDGKLPRLQRSADGTVRVELFSDLKRHDMGASLADAHSSFGVIAPSLFMTRPLWGVGVTAPYLHDGRAPDLQTAIALHDGEALSVRQAFLALPADSQLEIVEFLQTLSRDPQHIDD